MLDAVAEEDLGAAIIHVDGEAESEDALGPFAAFPDGLVEVEEIGDAVKLAGGHAEDGITEELLFHVEEAYSGSWEYKNEFWSFGGEKRALNVRGRRVGWDMRHFLMILFLVTSLVKREVDRLRLPI